MEVGPEMTVPGFPEGEVRDQDIIPTLSQDALKNSILRAPIGASANIFLVFSVFYKKPFPWAMALRGALFPRRSGSAPPEIATRLFIFSQKFYKNLHYGIWTLLANPKPNEPSFRTPNSFYPIRYKTELDRT